MYITRKQEKYRNRYNKVWEFSRINDRHQIINPKCLENTKQNELKIHVYLGIPCWNWRKPKTKKNLQGERVKD